jgi:hypothetical protein
MLRAVFLACPVPNHPVVDRRPLPFLMSFRGSGAEDEPVKVALRFPGKHYPPDYRYLIYQMVLGL